MTYDNPLTNPGGKEALANGCLCAKYDNHYGEGRPLRGERCFYITAGCPLHDDAKKEAMQDEAIASALIDVRADGKGSTRRGS